MKPIIENWNKFLNEDKDPLSKWEHKDAAKYAQELIDEYGEPDVITDSMVLWKGGISEFDQTYVKDESIPHDSPKPHHDFVYSTMEIDIPEDLMEAVAKASESIIVDQLKNEVTARCGDIFANAITLGFVQKLVAGDIKPEDAEEEYKKHILEGMLPDWFESAGGPVDEGKKKKGGKICPKGKAWAMRKYGKWSAYAAMGASKYCKDPNYGKGKKKDEAVQKEGELKKWRDEKWVQSDGTPCGDAKAQKNPKRCKPKSKWATMSKGEKKADDAKKKAGGKKGKQFVSGTKKGKVTKSHTKESLDMKLTKSQLEEIIQDELQSVLNETEEYCHIIDATYDDGTVAESIEFWDDVLEEAEYQGRKVTLNKPMQGDVKKSKVYVKNAKGNVVKVNFGDKKMRIRKSNPKARKSFRARHNCKNPGPKWKARYWSCKAW
tara:strand:+ start:645 stop:1946 length:1302 start_codon:yes stop_codon:yes gene_type:complete